MLIRVAIVFTILFFNKGISKNCTDCPGISRCPKGEDCPQHKVYPQRKHCLEHINRKGVGWTCGRLNIEKKQFVWAEFHCDQIRQLRDRMKDLESENSHLKDRLKQLEELVGLPPQDP